MSWDMNVSGFSGLSAVSTGWQGTGATSAAPATATAGGAPQDSTSIGTTCTMCSQPAVQQGLFFIAILLLLIGWHSHLYSMVE